MSNPDSNLGELNRIRKKISIGYFYVIIIVFSIFSVFYWSEAMDPFRYIMGFGLFFHSCFFFVPYKLDYKEFKPLVSVYLFFISIIVYPMVFLFWQVGQITSFLWFFLIPTASMLFYTLREIRFWCIYVFILICSIFLISFLLPEFSVLPITNKQITTINILTILSFLVLFFYFLYFMILVHQIGLAHSGEGEIDNIVTDNNIAEHEIERLNVVFEHISEYFKNKKPYCDPDFTISQLATAVDSNITYISKSIRLNKEMNFNVFVNSYRIDMIKDMLNHDYQNKYTIKYIYTSAGFRHQSTFNKVFKQITGITPSEYIKNETGSHYNND